MPGNSTGPRNIYSFFETPTNNINAANCTAGKDWFWTPDDCPKFPIDCHIWSNCSDCVADPSNRCRWCPSVGGGECLIADADNCSIGFLPLNCSLPPPPPPPPNPCQPNNTEWRSCISCTSLPFNCGWCDNSTCLLGSGSGPTNRTCNSWVFDNTQCSDTIACTDLKSCDTCLSLMHGKCGWCSPTDITGNCIPVSSSSRCSAPHWFPDHCPAIRYCLDYETCLDCTDFGLCYWCGTAQKGLCRDTPDVSSTCTKSQTYCAIPVTPSPSPGEIVGHGGLNGGVIAAIVVSAVLFVLGIGVGIAVVVWYRVYWKKRWYYETLK